METAYFYGRQADTFSFLRLPKSLMTDEHYYEMSLEAKILYGLLIDRMGDSYRNHWIDERNRVYVHYRISEVEQILNISKKKAVGCMQELEQYGLIRKVHKGNGLPNMIYISRLAA